MKLIILIISIIFLTACTDSAQGRLGTFGEEAQIKCYSGGQQIYFGTSTGKVSISKRGFVKFIEKESNSYIEINADCVIKYK